jgi:hypothetical protein
MSEFGNLAENPPKLEVPTNTTEVMIHLTSVMCDNKYLLKMYKTTTGWRLDTANQAFKNFQMKCEKYEIEWAADNDWDEAFRLINTGTTLISKIRCR